MNFKVKIYYKKCCHKIRKYMVMWVQKLIKLRIDIYLCWICCIGFGQIYNKILPQYYQKGDRKSMQTLREQKQQYLRQKILEQNYDPNEFMDFCQSSIGSMDIDHLTFDQLAKIVQDFVSTQNKNGYENDVEMKVGLDKEILNEFNQWDIYVQQAPTKVQQLKFELNLDDLDFLEGIAKPDSVNSSPQKAPLKNVQTSNSFMTVPADIVKKLQQGNDSFIVAYNPHSISPPKPMAQMKIQQKKPSISPVPVPINLSSVEEKKSEINTNYNFQFNPQVFIKTIPCKKIINKSRLNGNEDAIISGHQVINPNVFVPKYVLYFVTVNPQNVEVKRRLKDFESLRNLLIKFFPTTQIPHLERCSRLNETQPAIIKKQIPFLQSFLNNLIMKKQLKCKLLEQFLLCKDLDLLKKVFKQYEKLAAPRSLESLFSLSGEIQLKLSPQSRKYVNEQLTFNQFMQEHFAKMKNLYDTLIQGLEQNVKIITDIEEMHKGFKEKFQNINRQFTPQYQNVDLQKSMQRVQLMHRHWAASFRTQVSIIQSEIRHLYRYEQDNVLTLNQLLKFQQQITSSYNKRSDKDTANREKYQSKRLQQFKINLEHPSKNTTVLKHQAAYMQEKASQESLKYLSDLGRKIDHKFELFCTLQYNICQNMQNVWKSFETYYR